MRLKKLELYGFKSFAQRTEIVFHEGITGIVGPNGSGKSNIGDGVRWVLGEQSARTLRGANMSDVIFGGTQRRKPLTYCEVSLVFDNEDFALPVTFSEVMITRRVYRNGESEYFLNRSTCRLKDIIDLFRDTGIGKEGYSIIGQGRIDEILSRRGEDRRQVFEEAAGIVKFKARKEEADKKLERTLDNARRVDDILEELERQIGPLEKQAAVARDYLTLSTQLKAIDLNLFLYRTDRAKERLAELDQELAGFQTALSDGERLLAQKGALRADKEAAVADLDEKITGARKALMAFSDRVHQAQGALTALESRREARQESEARLRQEQQDSLERREEILRMSSQSDTAARQREALVAEGESALQEAESRLAEAKALEAARQEELDQHKEAILAAMNRLSSMRNDHTRLTTMQGQMRARLAELQQSSNALREEEQRLADEEASARERLQAEQAAQQALGDTHQALIAQREALDQRLMQLRQEVDQQAASQHATASRAKLLEEMTREMEGFSQAVKQAVSFATKRSMTGVHGVLAQLITVPRAYETAIDMALGAALQNVVTDTAETAKVLIDHLRQNKLGRATFLPMSSIRSKLLDRREQEVLTMPGCVGVASDLVECAPMYRGIVENLLGRTVIAENLGQGIPIMKAGDHRFRLVTLQGDVMHSGGSMTGGSTASRAVSLLSRQRELAELRDALKEGAAKERALRETLQQEQARKDQMKLQVTDALEALHQQEIAVARETAGLESTSAALSAHRERMTESQQAEIQLAASIEEIDAQLNEADAQSGTAQMDQTAMEAKTQVLQLALNEAHQQAESASHRAVEAQLSLQTVRHEADSFRRELARYQQDEAQWERDQARRTRQLEEMAAMEQRDAGEAERLTAEIALRQQEQAHQEEVTVSLEERRHQAQETLRQLTAEMDSIHQTQSRDGDKAHRTELARTRVDSDIRALQERIWNTYEMTYANAEPFRQEEGFDPSAADKHVHQLTSDIRALGTVNVNAVEEFADAKSRYDDLKAQQQDLMKAEQDLRELIAMLLEQMKTQFVENFSKLQGYFSETFQRLFGGGHAELSLVDPSDPLNCGIEVNAQPPGKKLQLLSLLSGGERALTAIAILFAMLKLKPTPFCILDEIEAALDDANIGYFADYLVEYSKSTQFVVVTHRKGTMERCDSLYGVAMEEQGVSKMVSIELKDYKE